MIEKLLLLGIILFLHFRRGGLMVNNAISLVAAVFLGFAKLANSFAMLIIGKALIGIFADIISLCTNSVQVYFSFVFKTDWN